jgi:chemotaxis protein MotB
MEQEPRHGSWIMSEQNSISQEIIIVRRNNGDGDGGHHGGAWKIAYADFVTAMMAFFLVMWLVNSANEVTKSRVASYFNPIKMTDSAANSRGLKTPTDKDRFQKSTNESSEAQAASEKKPEQKRGEVSDEELLKNPFKTMDRILSEAQASTNEEQNQFVNGNVGDPFDPKAWEALRNQQTNQEMMPPPQNRDPSDLNSVAEAEGEKGASVDAPINKTQGSIQPVPVKDEETVRLQETLSGLVEKYKSNLDISVDVRRTDEGLLIELGDKSGRGMFSIGSAEPSAGLINIVGVIGKLLSEQEGNIVIRGHTDGRRFKAGQRDNWQLSTARAHMASYMLMRGGLDERRIKRVEGHGAASPFDASNPFADSNRRVEFLLQSQDIKR